MDLPQIKHGHKLLTAIILLFTNLYLSHASEPQGNRHWYMTSDVKEISGKSYDYIVVGGGTAGCPLAATLSKRFNVLLVERGGSPYGNPLVMEKKFCGFSFIQTDKYNSVAQSFTSEEGVFNLRGRVLGGSSAINLGFYSRASKNFIRKASWDAELVRDSYNWVESRVVFQPKLTPWQAVINVSLIEAGILPYNGFSLEHIKGTKVSGSVFDESGRRHTSADLLEGGHPKHITVLVNATVKSIIFNKNGDSKENRAHGIRFIQSNGSLSQTFEAYLKQPRNSGSWGDVILAAGSLGSPQVLLLSGIGPQKHLKNFNIPLVADLKKVGQGMQDNPSIGMQWDAKSENRLPEPNQVVGIADDFKIIVEGFITPIRLNATSIAIAGKIAFPASRGKLELKNADPRQNPAVNFNYLSSEKDLDECIKMSQLLDKVASSEEIAFFLGIERKNKSISTEDEVRKFCKKNVMTYFHYHGGCAVGSVVDNDYRVYGVKGVRVVDGSTFSESPGTNPMATLLMLGRYQGIKILREREVCLDA
ncbi:Protein HOTHEAD [Quillaja saponaria]|uniref:Protein HOTHEAD n=1 Tax=Quillaja saponaria TaxID=32244 RepID=A0AAD7L9X5_QUISA|nr:Protein HOTHEAD [Quillaja saponaria]